MKKQLLLCFFTVLLLLVVPSQQSQVKTDYFTYKQGLFGKISIRYGVYQPVGRPKLATMYFFHGFSDRFDNHEPLFESWTKQGIEVRAFDLPSHGINHGFANNINLYRFRDIGKIFCQFVSMFPKEFFVPVMFGGWSLGGLIITRFMQEDYIRSLQQELPNVCYLDWDIRGILLLTPAVYTYPLIGELGIITVSSLTSNPNPPLAAPPKPSSVFLIPEFGARIELNAKLARDAAYRKKLNMLLIVGGDAEDIYCNTPDLKTWAKTLQQVNNLKFSTLQCEKAYHMVDNEPEPVASSVQVASTKFILDSVRGVPTNATTTGPCYNYLESP